MKLMRMLGTLLALAGLGLGVASTAQAQAPAKGISRNKRQPDLVDRAITTLAFDRVGDGRPQAAPGPPRGRGNAWSGPAPS